MDRIELIQLISVIIAAVIVGVIIWYFYFYNKPSAVATTEKFDYVPMISPEPEMYNDIVTPSYMVPGIESRANFRELDPTKQVEEVAGEKYDPLTEMLKPDIDGGLLSHAFGSEAAKEAEKRSAAAALTVPIIGQTEKYPRFANGYSRNVSSQNVQPFLEAPIANSYYS